MSQQSYRSWAAQNQTSTPLTDEQRLAAWQWSQIYGPANCWTGGGGAGAVHVRRLLMEVERLRQLTEGAE